MQFEFRPVKKKIDLSEYADEMAGIVIQVRVNVPREMFGRMLKVKGMTDDEFFALLSELWGEEEWPVEDIRKLREHCQEFDPMLWVWLTKRTWDTIFEYKGAQKKT